MKCFNHSEVSAVGICKSCYKAICKGCATELEHGLSCSEVCSKDISEVNQMNEKGKKLYGIGERKSKIPSTGVLLWMLIALVNWVVAFFSYYINGELSIESMSFAIGFTIVAVFCFISSKRSGLQC